MIGFVAYGAYRDDTLPGCDEVYAPYVLREYHERKVGLRLMNAAEERLAGYSRIALWVLRGNDRAIAFYEKYGFCLDGMEAEINLDLPCTELCMMYEK